MRLEGKTALIVGGTTGIGLSTASLFLKEGAQVAVAGRSDERLEAARASLNGAVHTIRADLRRPGEIQTLTDAVAGWTNALDILVINAGVSRPATLGQITPEFYDEHMDTNVRGPLFTLQSISSLLVRGSAVVVTTSCLDQMGRPGMAVYAASKAALRSLVRTFAAEFTSRGVRINAVAPGPVDSGIHDKMGLLPEAVEAMKLKTAQTVPMGRLGQPGEVAAAVLFLASPESSFITGAELLVDGGWASI